jgi:hypothetical protein
MLKTGCKPIAGKIEFNLKWRPIWAFDKTRTEGKVYLRSSHYSSIKTVPCRLVKLCHAAEEYAEFYQ